MRRYLLNRPMVLEAAQTAPDGAGGQVMTWAALGTLWVELRPGAGGERLGPIAPEGAMAFRAYCRAAPPGSPRRPRPDQRLREGARTFAILAVAEADPDGAHLVCLLRETVPA